MIKRCKSQRIVSVSFWKGDWTVMMDAESDREAYSAEFDFKMVNELILKNVE